jgi:hypothetical protein
VSFIWVDLEEDASDWGNEEDEDEEDAVDDGKLMMVYVSCLYGLVSVSIVV